MLLLRISILLALTAAVTLAQNPLTREYIRINGRVIAIENALAAGAASNLGHAVEYKFNWGDGSSSAWLTGSSVSANHTWTSPGYFTVSVQARCKLHPSITSLISPTITVNVAYPTAQLSISGTDFRVYDQWALWMYTNMPNTPFTVCVQIDGGPVSCAPNYGTTDGYGNWYAYGFFERQTGNWTEWVEFPNGTRSNNIYFTVSDYATLNISSELRLGSPWTLTLYSSIPNTSFTICAQFPDNSVSCTPNFGQTDYWGNWSLTGTFTPDLPTGLWREWVEFPSVNSNILYFVLNP